MSTKEIRRWLSSIILLRFAGFSLGCSLLETRLKGRSSSSKRLVAQEVHSVIFQNDVQKKIRSTKYIKKKF